jgi:hypothetical protein
MALLSLAQNPAPATTVPGLQAFSELETENDADVSSDVVMVESTTADNLELGARSPWERV